MRVAVVTTFYPNVAEPGRAVFVRNLVQALDRYVSLRVVSPVPYAPPISRHPRWRGLRSIPLRAECLPYEVLHPRYVVVPKCARLSGFTYFLGVCLPLRRLVRSEAIDLLHVHCAFPDAVGVALAASFIGLPFVVTAHGSDINVYAEQRSIRWQVARALARAGAVIAVSLALKRKIGAMSPSAGERVVHIPCAGVDPRVFRLREQALARGELGLPPDGRIVLFAGQFVTIKAVDVLLAACRNLMSRQRLQPNDLVVLAGEGPERKALEAQAAGLHGTVRFVGEVSQARLATWMSAATLFCLPSRNEGTPNVVIEALASGRPVVASRVGGVPEVISDGVNGLLAEPGNAAALADAIAAAFDRHWDAPAIAATVKEFTWDELARRNLTVLEGVLGQRRGRN
ncbi:MAG: glycosyltransferase [Steroidobacteraceae bacterium]